MDARVCTARTVIIRGAGVVDSLLIPFFIQLVVPYFVGLPTYGLPNLKDKFQDGLEDLDLCWH